MLNFISDINTRKTTLFEICMVSSGFFVWSIYSLVHYRHQSQELKPCNNCLPGTMSQHQNESDQRVNLFLVRVRNHLIWSISWLTGINQTQRGINRPAWMVCFRQIIDHTKLCTDELHKLSVPSRELPRAYVIIWYGRSADENRPIKL
jgi:hypothetical protein